MGILDAAGLICGQCVGPFAGQGIRRHWHFGLWGDGGGDGGHCPQRKSITAAMVRHRAHHRRRCGAGASAITLNDGANIMSFLTQQHIDAYNRDGFVIIENILTSHEIDAARARFEPLFSGKFQTGLYPDEWNWRMGRDREDLTRQICNGWKSDLTIASIVLRADVGEACARLRRMAGRAHRPGQCDLEAAGNETARLSSGRFLQRLDRAGRDAHLLDHARRHQGLSGNHRICARLAPLAGGTADQAVPCARRSAGRPAFGGKGGRDRGLRNRADRNTGRLAVFHHGRTWHGSRDNKGDKPRRAVIAHCISSAATFHPTKISYIYSRYKKSGRGRHGRELFSRAVATGRLPHAWLDGYIAGGHGSLAA